MKEEGVFTDGIDTRLCHQIAAVVDGLSCGLIGKIVVRLEGFWAMSSTGRAWLGVI